MGEALETVPMSEFPLRWRFAEDATRWAVLPAADLRHFRPLSEACSRALWRRFVSPDVGSRTDAGPPGFVTRVAGYRTDDDWSSAEEAERAGAFVRQHVPVRPDAGVLFFWDSSCGVETNWGVLLRHWSDFNYPSDDSNIVVPTEGDCLIGYVEGWVWAVPRGHSVWDR